MLGLRNRRGLLGRRLGGTEPIQNNPAAVAGGLQMPGPIGGFGGGTYNLDGTQATPALPAPMPNAGPLGSAIAPPQPQPQQTGPLGASMRQPFDYEAAVQTMAGNQKGPKDWQKVMAVIGDALVSSSGGQPMAVNNLMAQQQGMQDRMQAAREQALKWQHQAYQRQNEADLRAADPFTIGRSRLAYNPATGQTNALYTGPQDSALYAQDLGLEPGTKDYFEAVEDYVLRGSGPSAHERDIEMDDLRTENDRGLESFRQGNRVSLERMRQRGRLSMEDERQGNRMQLRRTPSAGRAPAQRGSAMPTATGADGRKVQWNGKAWVPVR